METMSNENSLSKDTDSEENDLVLKLKKLNDRVAIHETEKQKMREEFGQQRAKMKELFLQKEEELKKESTEQDRLKDVIKKLENDLNDARTQLTVVRIEFEGQIEEEKRRYRDEVASLQQLITETVDESSRNEEEVKKLKNVNDKLEAELFEFRGSGEGVTGSGGAQLLTAPTAMISTFARRVVSQLGADTSAPSSLLQTSSSNVTAAPDNLEESMRKAQEDAEVLRSLVIPLEEEIKALKDKLRETDEKLRKYEANYISKFGQPSISASDDNLIGETSNELVAKLSDKTTNLAVVSSPSSGCVLYQRSPQDEIGSSSIIPGVAGNSGDLTALSVNLSSIDQQHQIDGNQLATVKKRCETCANYELQLVGAQEKYKELEKQIVTLERSKEELAKEAAIRKDMEQKWIEKKELHKTEVVDLQDKVKEAVNELKAVKELYKSTKTQLTEELNRLTSDRLQVQLELDRLQMDNENLIGKRNANARSLQDEYINLPDNVEELQEMLLKCREDLISARVGQEAAEQEVATLKEEAQLHRYQTQAETKTRQQLKTTLTSEIESLKLQLEKSEIARHQSYLDVQRLNTEEKNLRLEIEDLNVQKISLANAKKHLEDQVSELKSRLSSLQAELHNSEIVQKDFVRLSQSLQQELERIRSSHTQVRWEHEDDVEQCPGCRQLFGVTRRKQHCKHCGRIFCVSCLDHTVYSGPNQRPSKVCDVCHTLLVEDTAPYFSTEPPHSNN